MATRLEATVRSIRFLRDDVALVHLGRCFTTPNRTPTSALPTRPTMVVSKGMDSEWQIDAFQNTPKMPPPPAPPSGS